MSDLLVKLAGFLEGQQLEDQALMLGTQLDSASRGLVLGRLTHPRGHGKRVAVDFVGLGRV